MDHRGEAEGATPKAGRPRGAELDGHEPPDLRRRRQRALAWALSLLLPASVLAFGAVHAEPRLLLAGVGTLLGVMAWATGGGRRGAPPRAVLVVGWGSLAAGLSALAFVPMPSTLRAALQPGLIEALGPVLGLLGGASRSRVLALDPSRGLVEWATLSSGLLVLLGAAMVVRNRNRARRLAAVIVATAAGTCLLHLAQRAGGASTIFWFSDLPRTPGQAFVGSFINPNHAGMLMAAAAPAALALAFDRSAWARLGGSLGALLLLVGALASGSRGAPLLLACGLLAWTFWIGGPRLRAAAMVAIGLGLATVLLIGPVQMALWLTGNLDPGQRAAIAGGYQDVWSGRSQLYADVWAMRGAAPVLGVGPAGFDDAWRVLRSGTGFTVADHAHQELLQILIEQGPAVLLAVLIVTGLVLAGLAAPEPSGGRGLRRLQAAFGAALVVLLVAALYEFPFRAGALSTLGALCGGGILGLARSGPPLSRAALLPLGAAVIAAVLVSTGARLTGRGVFQDADAAVLEGRSVLSRGGIDRRQGYTAGGDPEVLRQAGEAFERAIWSRPVHRIALQELAMVRFREGREDEAEEILLAATRVYPSLPWVWRDLARVRRLRGQEEAALVAWSQALRHDLPARFPLDSFLGEALNSPLGIPVAALLALPPRADRWEAAARLLERRGDRQDALDLYREAAALDPAARAPLAQAMVRFGLYEEVVTLLADPLPSCGEQRALGEALRRLDRCPEALPRAEAALLACGAYDWDARLLIARVRLCQGEERAVPALEALIRERPDDPGPRRSLAPELARRGRVQEARDQLRALARLGPLREEERLLLASLEP